MSESVKALIAIVSACIIWGLSPLFYYTLAHVPPLELLSHRTLWSLAIFSIWLTFQGRLSEIWQLLWSKSAIRVAIAAILVSINWGAFILSVQIGMLVESSLGYFIYPLMMALIGWMFFGERLTLSKLVALMLAFIAVSVLTYGLGVAPWLALLLAGTFSVYSAIKKTLQAGPILSVTCEVMFLAPLAAIWLFGTHQLGWEGIVGRNGSVFGSNLIDSFLLILSGAITAGPLMLLGYSSRRLQLSTVGMVQYLNPSLQFFCAVAVIGETITPWHVMAFPIIWLALVVYSLGLLFFDKPSRSV